MKAPFVSQREIAAAAGVSVSAVSLALRNHPKVSPQVRARIHAIAKRMGISPKRAEKLIGAALKRVHAVAGGAL